MVLSHIKKRLITRLDKADTKPEYIVNATPNNNWHNE